MSSKFEPIANTSVRSFPLASIVCVIFVVFKIIGYFPYSWWVVFAPIWAPLALVVGVFVIIGLIAIIAAILEALLNR